MHSLANSTLDLNAVLDLISTNNEYNGSFGVITNRISIFLSVTIHHDLCLFVLHLILVRFTYKRLSQIVPICDGLGKN